MLRSGRCVRGLLALLPLLRPCPEELKPNWTMEELWCLKAGETRDFEGVKATWPATEPAAILQAGTRGSYSPMQIHRDSLFLYVSGNAI